MSVPRGCWILIGMTSLLTAQSAYQNAVFSMTEGIMMNLTWERVAEFRGIRLQPDELSWMFSLTLILPFYIGVILGSTACEFILDEYGRKLGMIGLPAVINIFGCLAIVLGPYTLILVFVGRILVGMAWGLFLVSQGTMVMECVPIQHRWQYISSVGWIPSVLCLILYRSIPDSPRFLYAQYFAQDQNKLRQKRLLQQFYHGSAVDVSAIFTEFESDLQLSSLEHSSSEQAGKNLRSVWQQFHLVFSQKHFWMPYILSIAIAISQNTTGNEWVLTFLSETFQAAGFDRDQSNLYIILLFIPSMVCALIGCFLIDKWGRRPLLIWSIVVSTVAAGMIMTAELWPTWKVLSPIGACIILASFYACMGTVPDNIFGELCPQGIRAFTGVSSLNMNWIWSGSLSTAFPYLHLKLGGFVQLILILPNVFLIIPFLLIAFPETQGRSVSEIVRRWTPDYVELTGMTGGSAVVDNNNDKKTNTKQKKRNTTKKTNNEETNLIRGGAFSSCSSSSENGDSEREGGGGHANQTCYSSMESVVN